MRAFKTVNDTFIEPISFVVPRKAEVFQEDIYPPAIGLKPAMSSAEWFGGNDGVPPKISLESIYDGASEPKEVPSDYKPQASTPIISPSPTKTAQEPAKPATAPEPELAKRGPPPEIKDNKASISAMASRFADNGDEDDEDDESSFEEVQKPVERPSATAARMEEKTRGPAMGTEPPTKEAEKLPSPTTIASANKPTAAAAPSQPPLTRADSSSKLWTKTSDGSTPTSPPKASAADGQQHPAEGLRAQLADMRDMHQRTLSLLESQQRALGRQMDQIMFLSAEIETFKTRLQEQRSGREKDERIRRLELEVEELRGQVEG